MSYRIALIGGVYNNYIALQSTLEDAREQGVDQIFCLGDLGAFGPYPDKVFPLLREYDVLVVQGNYDHSVAHGLNDCQCGYTDPRDNYYAQLSYDYTFKNTSSENKRWMKDLPAQRRLDIGTKSILLCHGSPRQSNEFLWESTTSTQFIAKLLSDYNADIIAVTHTGIHWQRRIDDRLFINVGVIGRPENDGDQRVGYMLLEIEKDSFKTMYRRISYDYQRLAREMRRENIVDPFIETISTGWWTTCLEILPVKERVRGKY